MPSAWWCGSSARASSQRGAVSAIRARRTVVGRRGSQQVRSAGRLRPPVYPGITGPCCCRLVFRARSSCGSDRPFGLPRPAAATTTTPKREPVLANTVGEIDAGDRNGRVVERLEAGHRGAAPLDRAVVLFDEAVEILVRANCDVAPSGAFASRKPQRTPTWWAAFQNHLSRDARTSRRGRWATERPCGGDATVTVEQEIDRLAVLVDGAVSKIRLRLVSRCTSRRPATRCQPPRRNASSASRTPERGGAPTEARPYGPPQYRALRSFRPGPGTTTDT
jgi:hypothetical protein